MVAMAITLTAVDCKLFQVIPYITILNVRKFHQPNAKHGKEKPRGGGGGGGRMHE